MTRVFFAHRKNEDRFSIEEALEAAAHLLGPDTHIVSGVRDWEDHFGRCGGWTGWTRDVAQGVDYLTRAPRYDAFIVPDADIGKATRDIVAFALDVKKPVLYWQPGGVASRVVGVAPNESGDWKAGWTLVLDNCHGGE